MYNFDIFVYTGTGTGCRDKFEYGNGTGTGCPEKPRYGNVTGTG